MMTEDLSDTRNSKKSRQHELESEGDEGEWNDDSEMAQMQDDVLREQERQTEEITESFERLSHSSDDFDPMPQHTDPSFIHRIEHSEPLGDDIYENTDTEDGGYDIIDLIESNRKLISFLARQKTTITRLRARIVRMGDLISILNANIDDTTRNAISTVHGHFWNVTRDEHDDELVSVLMDVAGLELPTPTKSTQNNEVRTSTGS